MQQPTGRGVAASLVTASAVVLTGCAAGDNIVASMALPTGESVQPLPSPPEAQPSQLEVTPRQQAYLSALVGGGVRPSSDLLALRIGSYVCQARAARQSDEAVWDFVLPLVRSDVDHARINSMAPTQAQVGDETAGYIRIATERLC